MGAINLGPFAFPVRPLLLFCAALVSLAAAKWMGRSRSADVEPLLWKALVVGVAVARIAFVLAYFDAYRGAPWSMLDLRDGGLVEPAGLAASLAMLAWFAWCIRERRKPLALSLLAGAFVWITGIAATTVFYPATVELPQLALTRLDDGATQLKSLEGKPMVINLWATWCPPCRREMPVLRDAQARNRDIVFVFVNQGEPAEAVRKYLETEHLALDNVLLDRGLQLGSQTGSRALPTTLFFNDKGILIQRRIGELSAATLAQRIESLRAVRRPRMPWFNQ